MGRRKVVTKRGTRTIMVHLDERTSRDFRVELAREGVSISDWIRARVAEYVEGRERDRIDGVDPDAAPDAANAAAVDAGVPG